MQHIRHSYCCIWYGSQDTIRTCKKDLFSFASNRTRYSILPILPPDRNLTHIFNYQFPSILLPASDCKKNTRFSNTAPALGILTSRRSGLLRGISCCNICGVAGFEPVRGAFPLDPRFQLPSGELPLVVSNASNQFRQTPNLNKTQLTQNENKLAPSSLTGDW